MANKFASVAKKVTGGSEVIAGLEKIENDLLIAAYPGGITINGADGIIIVIVLKIGIGGGICCCIENCFKRDISFAIEGVGGISGNRFTLSTPLLKHVSDIWGSCYGNAFITIISTATKNGSSHNILGNNFHVY